MFKLLTGEAAIRKAIGSINTRGKKLDKDIQIAALSIIAHIDAHNDVTLATKLVEAMPKGARTNALKAYMETFSQAVWVMGSKDAPAQFAYDRKKTTDMDGAHAIMWTEFKPEPEYQPIDIVATVTNLLKRIEKDTAKNGTKYDAGQIKALEAITHEEPAH